MGTYNLVCVHGGVCVHVRACVRARACVCACVCVRVRGEVLTVYVHGCDAIRVPLERNLLVSVCGCLH